MTQDPNALTPADMERIADQLADSVFREHEREALDGLALVWAQEAEREQRLPNGGFFPSSPYADGCPPGCDCWRCDEEGR